MSLNPDLGHLYHDSEISGEFIAIDAKERLRTREINAREQRHLDFQNHVLTRARDICERSRNWERWNVERQMRCLKEKTPSLQHSLAQEANKLKRYEKMMQEMYGGRSPLCNSSLGKHPQAGTFSKKPAERVPFANVSQGRSGRGGGGGAGSLNGAASSSFPHGASGRGGFGHAAALPSKPDRTKEEEEEEEDSVTQGSSSFFKAGRDGADYLSRNSVFVDAAQNQVPDDQEEALRYGKEHYSPAATLARPRNLRRRNERVVRSLLRLYHRVDDRKRELERAHSEGGMSKEAILEHALVVLRGTPEERMVESLLAQLRFGAPSPRRHMSDSFLDGALACSSPASSSSSDAIASSRRRHTDSDSQLRIRKFRRNLAEALVSSPRKPSGSFEVSGESRDHRRERQRGWGRSSAASKAESPRDDSCVRSVDDVFDAEIEKGFVGVDATSEKAEVVRRGLEEEEQLGGGDKHDSRAEVSGSFTTLPTIPGHRE